MFSIKKWLNSKTFKPTPFFDHGKISTQAKILWIQVTHATHAKISTYATHTKIFWAQATHPTYATHFKISTHVTHTKIFQTHATYGTHTKIWPTPITSPRYQRANTTHTTHDT